MRHILKHNRIISCHTLRHENTCNGSSKWKWINYNNDYLSQLNDSYRLKKQVDRIVPIRSIDNKEIKSKQYYSVNASKVRDKVIAYSLLNKSLSFLAFFSISFPVNIPDNIAYKIFNIWLTRLRRDKGLKSYIWVTERQGNGTLHYHMLTNDYMNVRELNKYMAISIDNYVHKGECSWGNSSINKYNGVDVVSITSRYGRCKYKSKQAVINKVIEYLTKYMTKDVIETNHRIWHCSRLVSALFISIDIDNVHVEELMQLPYVISNSKILISSEFFSVTLIGYIESSWHLNELHKLNNIVYQFFSDNKLW